LPVEEAAFMSPGRSPTPLSIEQEKGRVSFTLPSVRVYGVVIMGKRGLDRGASALAIGDALLARAQFACDGDWGASTEEAARILKAKPEEDAGADAALAYASAARKLIEKTATSAEAAYLSGVKAMGDIEGVTLALDFGGKQPQKGWETVSSDTAFGEGKMFGWLPVKDASQPTPEEIHYAMASRFKQKAPASLQEGFAIFWPYSVRPPAPVASSLFCGGPRSFRLVLKNSLYKVRVVTMNPSWILRNYLISGMVSANGAAVLLDMPHNKGSIQSRTFSAEVTDSSLDLTFGGPTGWGVAAVVVEPAVRPVPDPLAAGAIREWKLSPRYPNAAWYPIQQTLGGQEKTPAAPDTKDWKTFRAPSKGIALIDLGNNQDAEVGDVVYALATIETREEKRAMLHLGASSEAMAWLNGEKIAFLPNVKGVQRDEFAGRIRLKKGQNVLLLKLSRFWERRWMFYAAVSE
ncbi:MAG: hypothetical protein QF886_21560, partial [Planctomycetota bacterium]|nr:hypothetical protein [Planctomycetota bacterium]